MSFLCGKEGVFFVRLKRSISIFFAVLLLISSVAIYPANAFAEKRAYEQEFYSNPDNLLSLLPETNSHKPVMNPAQGIVPSGVPNASPEVPNSDVSPRRQQEAPPIDDSAEEPPVKIESGFLDLKEADVSIPQVLQPFGVTRDYSSNNEETGPFGKGWTTSLDSKIGRASWRERV